MLNLRSNEEVNINGHKMPRWLAERSGLIPVTVVRALRCFINSSLVPATWIPIPAGPIDRARLFPADNYQPAIKSGWHGMKLAKDGFGNTCVAFWPKHFKETTQP